MYKHVSALLVSGILALHSFAQSPALEEKSAKSLLYQNAAALHLGSEALKNTRISSFYYDKATGVTMLYLQQTFKGVDIANAITPVAFKDGKPVTVPAARVLVEDAIAANSSGKPAVTAVAALRTAAAALNLPLQQAVLPLMVSADKHEYEFDKLGISYNNIFVHLLWVPSADATHAELSWQVNIQLAKNNENWLVKIDAQKGNVLAKENLTVNDLEHVHIDASKRYNTKSADGGKSVESVSAIASAAYKVIPYPAMDPDHIGTHPRYQSMGSVWQR